MVRHRSEDVSSTSAVLIGYHDDTHGLTRFLNTQCCYIYSVQGRSDIGSSNARSKCIYGLIFPSWILKFVAQNHDHKSDLQCTYANRYNYKVEGLVG